MKKLKTKKSLVIAMVGLVGSGKNTIAQALAKQIGAKVIDADEIRIALRKMGKNYDATRHIAETIAGEIIRRGRNVVLASDFVDAKKRKLFENKAKQWEARVKYVRVVADRDVMIGRILSASYKNTADDFFGGASTAWRGNSKYHGAIVKMREMWRRTPHHYQWVNKNGGAWLLKKLPIKFFAVIDATDPKLWKSAVRKVSQRLKRD
ncbi:dephospho-CoA kinase [Patescibacteria group bacterium]|nr:dephospho-CoA kinase [Patescibacteria group bacterium]